MEQNHNPALKILAFVGIIAVALIILSASLGMFSNKNKSDELAPLAQDSYVKVTTATSTATVVSDMDSFLNAVNNVPSAADFNDSYVDLNR